MTNTARPKRKVVLRFPIPRNLLNSLLATRTPLDVHVEITPRTNKRAPVSLVLSHVLTTGSDPACKRGDAVRNVVP